MICYITHNAQYYLVTTSSNKIIHDMLLDKLLQKKKKIDISKNIRELS